MTKPIVLEINAIGQAQWDTVPTANVYPRVKIDVQRESAYGATSIRASTTFVIRAEVSSRCARE
jgi:hypothetical protein